jgi:hypothetical protein
MYSSAIGLLPPRSNTGCIVWIALDDTGATESEQAERPMVIAPSTTSQLTLVTAGRPLRIDDNIVYSSCGVR